MSVVRWISQKPGTALVVSKRRSKYNVDQSPEGRAKRTRTVDGKPVVFASLKEARRYDALVMLQRGKQINMIELQPKYALVVRGEPVLLRSKGYPNGRKAHYVGDFSYYDCERNAVVVEDVKGQDTALSQLKRALVEAIYGVRVVLV